MKTIFTLLMALLLGSQMALSQANSATTLYFDHNQALLSNETKQKLNKIVAATKTRVSYQVQVCGFTDGDGTDAYNKVLSKRRMEAVAEYLRTVGISKDHIKTSYLGENKPVASNETDQGKLKNRRVEVKILEQELAVPTEFKVSFKKFSVVPGRDTALRLDKKGTVLHVPGNCFTNDKGEPIKEKVTLHYREFTNAAEIAFSAIPMNYKNSEGQFQFNSAGMFELNASAKSGPVKMAKDKRLKIDYALAKKTEDIDFYRLNENKTNWQKVQPISSRKPEPAQQGPARQSRSDEPVVTFEFPFKVVKLTDEAQIITEFGKVKPNQATQPAINFDDRRTASLLGDGCGDPGHTYPDVVKGLNMESFGVYNCDQVYRLANRVNIQAKYETEKGEPIADPYVLSLIDLKYNGAFSFHPSGFSCDAKADNVLALFTKSGRLYVLDKTAFAQMQLENGNVYTFKMKDMSGEIKSSADLAKFLGLKT